MRAEDLFHTGIVVDDLEETLERLSELFGYRWCGQIAVPSEVCYPDGSSAVLDLRFHYSATVPRLEVIQSIPGSLWQPAAGSGIHHLGYWSDDVAADSAELERRGLPLEVYGARDGAMGWAYHRGPSGPRVELVSTASRPGLEGYFASGSAQIPS